MKIKEVKVKSVINSIDAFDPIAYKLFEELQSIFKISKVPTLVVIDFSNIQTLTYEFVEKSLKTIIETDNNNNLIFLYKFDFEDNIKELITGHIDALNLRERNKSKLNERELLSQNYSLTYIDSDNEIHYLGNLNEVDKFILDIIEEIGSTNHTEIDEFLRKKNKLNYCEEISTVIAKLKKLGFIYHFSNGEESPSEYKSLKYYLENGISSN